MFVLQRLEEIKRILISSKSGIISMHSTFQVLILSAPISSMSTLSCEAKELATCVTQNVVLSKFKKKHEV